VHDAAFWTEHSVELRPGVAVQSVDLGGRTVTLAGGEPLAYDRLLLATGAVPRRLALPGGTLPGVHYLRDLADADRLREAFAGAGRVAVVGAGWIGAEVAASARTLGLPVTLVEGGPTPLVRVLGERMGEWFSRLHRERGVDLITGAGVAGFDGDDRVTGVRIVGGPTVEADVVVVGVGVVPRTELAEAAGLSVDNGITVDERLATAAPGVFAAGDVANWPHPFYGRRVRVEHWDNAIAQGQAAARSMLGRGEPFDKIPFFFSDQYDVGFEYAGLARGDEELVFRGDPDSGEFIVFWMDGDRVAAGMNVNVWDVADDIGALIRSRAAVDRRRLADVDTPLAEAVAVG
jgi:3-phenylpropionate/trans-cinnamate dioxygenase ferredoxin reductase subunit